MLFKQQNLSKSWSVNDKEPQSGKYLEESDLSRFRIISTELVCCVLRPRQLTYYSQSLAMLIVIHSGVSDVCIIDMCTSDNIMSTKSSSQITFICRWMSIGGKLSSVKFIPPESPLILFHFDAVIHRPLMAAQSATLSQYLLRETEENHKTFQSRYPVFEVEIWTRNVPNMK